MSFFKQFNKCHNVNWKAFEARSLIKLIETSFGEGATYDGSPGQFSSGQAKSNRDGPKGKCQLVVLTYKSGH